MAGGFGYAAPIILFGYLGGAWFAAFVVLLVLLAVYETTRLLHAAGYRASLLVAILCALAAFAGIRFPNLLNGLSLVLLGSLAFQLRDSDRRIGDWAVSFACGVYLGWTSGHLVALREWVHGVWWLAIAIGCTWATDSGAFVIGKLFGKHKLAPSISPKKTWEGYFGGVLFGVLAGAIIGWLSPLNVWLGAWCGLLVGTLSVFGDLIESWIKRQANAKDSGNLIPGHGGVFDRIDSLLWSGVLVFVVAALVV